MRDQLARIERPGVDETAYSSFQNGCRVTNAFLKEIELREAHKPRTELKPKSQERRQNNIHVHGGASAAALLRGQDLERGIDRRTKYEYCLGGHTKIERK